MIRQKFLLNSGCGGKTSTGETSTMDKRSTVKTKETKGRRRHKVDSASKKDKKVDHDKTSTGLVKRSMGQNRLGLSKSGLRFALAALV